VETLSFAVGPYDRVLPLFDGSIEVPGVRLEPRYISTPVELFSRMIAHGEFDIAEMSLTHCFVLAAQGSANFVALPVFPSRMFRHGFIFVNAKAGIHTPKDLEGKRIGVQGYQMTAAVWIRGLLREDYGVDLGTVQWWEGGVNATGVVGGGVMRLRPWRAIDVQTVAPGATLSTMLERGEIDALIGAFVPESFGRSAAVRRLFPDHQALERSYFARTGIFPIMHALAVRRDVLARHAGLPEKMLSACQRAQQIANRRLRFSAALSVSLPWLLDHAAETDQALGADFWTHGREENASALTAFSRMLVEDGLLQQSPDLDLVFAS